MSQALDLGPVDPFLPICYFFRAGNFETLSFFKDRNKFACIKERIVGACIEPGIATAHNFNVKLIFFEVQAIEVGDFQLTTLGRFQAFCQFDNLLVIKVESGDNIVGLWLFGLFFKR